MPSSLQRRLATLERARTAPATRNDGAAPEAWGRLAQWAMAVHALGGWDALIAALDAGAPMPEPSPYDCGSGGLWDITVFWQWRAPRFLGQRRAEGALWIIVACVGQMLDDGLLRPEIMRWDPTGRDVWQAVNDALLEAADAQP